MMIQTTIVSSRTLAGWYDRSIRMLRIKPISVDSTCTDSRVILQLNVKHSIEERMKIWKEGSGDFRGEG